MARVADLVHSAILMTPVAVIMLPETDIEVIRPYQKAPHQVWALQVVSAV